MITNNAHLPWAAVEIRRKIALLENVCGQRHLKHTNHRDRVCEMTQKAHSAQIQYSLMKNANNIQCHTYVGEYS